jgi:hypothetical protein
MDDDDETDDRTRRRQTWVALIAVALLALGGWWLASQLQRHRAVGDCIASGRRDCVPVENYK